MSNNATPQILIAEDSKTQAFRLKYILEEAGYQVHVAMDGKEALGMVKTKPPDIILTDIIMPEMNGYELCTAVKNDPSTADIPVILLTQLNDPVDVIRGLECKADNFIIKPYDEQILLSRIEVILANRALTENQMQIGIEITFHDKKYFIPSSRLQILNILLSTYEIAVERNKELTFTQERLAQANDQLTSVNEKLQIINEKLKEANINLSQEIHEREIAQKALSRSNKLIQLMDSVTRHDVLNQVAVINGYAMLLLDVPPDPDDLAVKLNRIHSAGEQIQRLIEFTRSYQELGVENPVWHNVKDIFVKRDIASFGNQLSFHLDVGDLAIYADRMLEKVFYNLLDNTTRHGGTASCIRVHSYGEGDTMILVYEDNGTGIPEQDKEKIFKQGVGKNTGLGLFLIREILELTGITIRETGVEGKGARFEMKIPPKAFSLSVPEKKDKKEVS